MKNNKKFTRILSIILSLFIVAIIIFSFIFSETKFMITTGIILCLCFLLIIVLSEVFDYFKIGQVIELERKVKDKNDELDKSKKEIEVLRNQLINAIGISATNTNNLIVGKEFASLFAGVKPIDEEEKIEKQKEIESIKEREQFRTDRQKLLKTEKLIENLLLEKFTTENNLEKSSLFKEVQFNDRFIGIDPVMDKNISFDAYYKNPEQEMFIEVKTRISPLSFDLFRLYYQLNKVNLYKQTVNNSAKVIMIIPLLNEEIDFPRKFNAEDIDRFKEIFKPAIANGILVIKTIKLEKEEIEN